jgi:AcrR family transcriptional regulator
MPAEPKIRISKKRQQIVETADGLFRRFGVKRVTVAEICHKAGTSKMTFYKYFTNKMELLRTIWDSWLDEGYARLDEIDAMDIPFAEKLQQIIEYKSKQLSRLSPEYMDEILHGGPEMVEFVRGFQVKNQGLFIEYLTSAQDKGDMRKMRPELFLAVLDKLNEITRDENLIKLYADHTEFVREVQQFLFFGILPVENRQQ